MMAFLSSFSSSVRGGGGGLESPPSVCFHSLPLLSAFLKSLFIASYLFRRTFTSQQEPLVTDLYFSVISSQHLFFDVFDCSSFFFIFEDIFPTIGQLDQQVFVIWRKIGGTIFSCPILKIKKSSNHVALRYGQF